MVEAREIAFPAHTNHPPPPPLLSHLLYQHLDHPWPITHICSYFLFFFLFWGWVECGADSRNSLPGPHSPPPPLYPMHLIYQHLDHPWPIAHICSYSFLFFCSFGGGSSVVEAREIAFPAHTPHPSHYIPMSGTTITSMKIFDYST